MPSHNHELGGFRAALDAAIPVPPSIESQASYLESAFSSRKSEGEVHSHFEAVWMASCGRTLHTLRANADLLLEWASTLAADVSSIVEQRRDRIRHVAVDSKGNARWNLATVIDMGVPLAQCGGLLLVGWIGSMATLVEASDIYQVFDSSLNRATFTLLPALGLCAGWKMLGARVAHGRRNAYWANVTKSGLVLGSIWVVLFGLKMGGVAWDTSAGDLGGGLLDEGGSGGGPSLGVWLVITGILAETLLAAAAWRRFESVLRAVFPYEVTEDPLTVAQDASIEDLEDRRRATKQLHGEYLGEIERFENARTAYADEGVAALAPKWSAPDTNGPTGPAPTDPTPPADPGSRRNGNLFPDMDNIR